MAFSFVLPLNGFLDLFYSFFFLGYSPSLGFDLLSVLAGGVLYSIFLFWTMTKYKHVHLYATCMQRRSG